MFISCKYYQILQENCQYGFGAHKSFPNPNSWRLHPGPSRGGIGGVGGPGPAKVLFHKILITHWGPVQGNTPVPGLALDGLGYANRFNPPPLLFMSLLFRSCYLIIFNNRLVVSVRCTNLPAIIFFYLVGLALASCGLLRSLGLKHPFLRSKGDQICFNGDFQHNYVLEKALNFHKYSGRPTISYTALNVPHDSFGIRTQTLNKGLIEHVRGTLSAGDTITLLLADHGNTYTPYLRQTLEGRFEMFHPSLFMIIPDSVAKILGVERMSELRANQRRLLTMLDLNAGLRAIVDLSLNGKMPEERGVFGLIPADKSCDDLNLKLPNLCVCEGWDNAAQNDSLQVAVLEFAVGFLNNEIVRQREASFNSNEKIRNHGTGHRCHHLVPLYFKNMRERNVGENLITTFDFVVSAGRGASQNEDIFHVEVRQSIRPNVLDSYVEMLSFDRLSQFGPYRECADAGVDARLCICSLDNVEKAKNGVSYVANMAVNVVTNYMPNLIGIPSKRILYNKKSDECVYLVARNYHGYTDKGKILKNRIQSAVLEAVNICRNRSFLLHVKVKLHLMKISKGRTFSVMLHPNSLTFLCTLVTENWSWPSNYNFEYGASPL